MTSESSKSNAAQDDFAADSAPRRPVPAHAMRALREAEERRAAYLRQEAALPREIGGRGGREPGRYGDWEVKGLASDF